MIGELNFFGVFLPALLPLAILALMIDLIARVLLQRVGFYRLVWHAGLFDIAMYVVTLWSLVVLTARVTP